MAFLEKPICPFPQETKVGEKEGWKQHLGPDRAERERPRDVQRAALLGVALSFQGGGGTTADGDKGPVGLGGGIRAGASAQEAGRPRGLRSGREACISHSRLSSWQGGPPEWCPPAPCLLAP